MVGWLVPQGHALLLQLFQPLAVDLDSAGAGLRDGVVPEDPAHVVEQPGHCQHRRGRTVFLQVVQKVLCILIALLGGLGQPICGFLLVVGNLLTSKVQLAQHILGVGISPSADLANHSTAASLFRLIKSPLNSSLASRYMA